MTTKAATIPTVRVTSAEVAQVLLKIQNVQVLQHFMTPDGISSSNLATIMGCPSGWMDASQSKA